MGVALKSAASRLGPQRLPSGAFTVDSYGRIVSSTVPQWVPEAVVAQIGQQIVGLFKGAAAARLPIAELKVQYEAIKITAREMRGGAIIFLSPKAPMSSLER